MLLDRDNLSNILEALERQIRARHTEAVSVIVCGGAALAALHFLNRTTKDVDVLALATETPSEVKVKPIQKLPAWLEEAASAVQRDFGLPDDWFNIGPAFQAEYGLPAGFARRLVRRKYGERLTVFFIGRLDQIHFKLYAAVDRNDYHEQDLKALEPTTDELTMACEWVLSQDPSEAFRMLLKEFLTRFGHGTLAEKF